MSLRWDPLLLRHLAAELDARLRGSRTRALRLDGEGRRLALLLRDATVLWDLHPGRGGLAVAGPTPPGDEDLPLPGRLRRVRSWGDERVLAFEILPERGRPPRDLVLEFLGSRWNAVVVERPAGTLRHVLVRRGAPRPLQVGLPYPAPPPSPREGVEGELTLERWMAILAPVPPPQRRRVLLASVAWTSSLNAGALLEGDPDPHRALEAGHRLWSAWVRGTLPPEPGVAALPEGPQPYPWPLPPHRHGRCASLVEAFHAAAPSASGAPAPAADPAPPLPARLIAALEARVDAARRKATRLRATLHQLPDPHALQARADLLLARLAQVPAGAGAVTLEGFDGAAVTLTLDPTLSPQANAGALYDEAGRARRGAERLPGLIRGAEDRLGALEGLLARARSGEATEADLRDVLPRHHPRQPPGPEGTPLPYRSFRSSGGLEIRVGRSARLNDDLTFRHSAPDDVWLHARHAQGAHVILRWGRDGNPPARDLEEAAALAALHSRARTSAVVPVDWARRKHLRKPRGAPPGAVTPDRVKTVMVRPDASLLDRLATDPD